MKIASAEKIQYREIASLIMEAMNYECCQNLAGKNHSLQDFHNLMCDLVKAEDSQYSYRNAITALSENGEMAGVCVSYNGADLHTLREAFIKGAKVAFGIDYSGMDDETESGELYIDSLCVGELFRHKGVATALLTATIEKAKKLNIRRVGLLVDKGNPDAEKLYVRMGFVYCNDTSWGGHEMKHLVYSID